MLAHGFLVEEITSGLTITALKGPINAASFSVAQATINSITTYTFDITPKNPLTQTGSIKSNILNFYNIKVIFPPSISVAPGNRSCNTALISGVSASVNPTSDCEYVDGAQDSVLVTNIFGSAFNTDGTYEIEIELD